MKYRIGNLVLGEMKKFLQNKLFWASLLFLFMMNLTILVVYDNSDSFQKSAYRNYKESYQSSMGSEREKIEQAYEDCLKIQVMANYQKELQSEKNGTEVFSYSKEIARNAGLSDEWYERVKGEYLAGNFVLYTDTLEQEAEFFNEVYQEISQIEGYPRYLNSIQEKIETSGEFKLFQEKQSEFSKKSLKKMGYDYNKLEGTKPSFAGTKGLSKVLGNSLLDITPCIFIMVLSILLILEDRRRGTAGLYYCTSNGHIPVCIAKTIVMFLGCIFVTLFYWGSTFLYIFKVYGNIRINAPVQSILGFQDCTLQSSIGKYLILFLIQKMAIYFVIGLVGNLLAVLSSRYITFFVSWGFIIAISFALLKSIPEYTNAYLLHYFNFLYLLQASPLIENYRNISFFGYPLSLFQASLIIMLVMIILVIIVTVETYVRKGVCSEGVVRKLQKVRWRNKERISTSIFPYEIYKLFIGNKLLAVLLLYTTVLMIYTVRQPMYLNEEQQYYKSYMRKLEGKVTEEKREYIKAEKQRIEDVLDKIQKLEDSYDTGEISKIQKNELVAGLELKIRGRNAFERVRSQLQYIDANPGEGYTFVYEDGWNEILGVTQTGYKHDMRSALLCVLLMIFSFGNMLPGDYEIETDRLQNASYRGKMCVIKNKLILASGVTIVFMLVTYASNFVYAGMRYGLHSLTAKTNSISAMADTAGTGGTILNYLVLQFGVRLIGYLVILVIMFGIEYMTKSALKTFLIVGLLFAVPIVLCLYGIGKSGVLIYNNVLSGNDVLRWIGGL